MLVALSLLDSWTIPKIPKILKESMDKELCFIM